MMLCWAMRWSHSIRAALVTAVALAAAARIAASGQQPIVAPTLQEAGAFSFTTFLRGVPIGTEQVALTRTADGWTIAAAGRLGAPLDVVARRGQAQTIRTTVQGTTATSEITSGTQKSQKSETIDGNALLILPNSFFGPYEALAARLRSA